jgi:hypothetical protein
VASSDLPTLSCWQLLMDVDLEPVLKWCVKTSAVNRLLVVTKFWEDARGRTEGPNPKILDAMEFLFSGRILRRVFARKWPGTEVIGSEGIVFVIEFDAALIEPMVQAAGRFADWGYWNDPPLPEDLCLYRHGDEWPAVYSTTHESDIYAIGETGPPIQRTVARPLDADFLGVPTGHEDFLVGAHPWTPGAMPLEAPRPTRPSKVTRRRGPR